MIVMKRKIFAIVMALMMLVAFTACGSSDSGTKGITLATGGPSGTYYAVGGVMASVLNPVLGDDLQITVTSTGASKANIQMIEDGEANVGLVQNDVMYYAYTGTDLFESDGKCEKFATVAGLYDETVHIVTCDPSIKTVADLKGKAVSVGDAGSGTEFNAKQVLAAYDLSFDDIKVTNASFGDSAESLKDGKIDAAFIVAGAPTTAVTDLAAAKPIFLVELDDEHIAKLQSSYNFYTETIIPGGTYKDLNTDSKTVSVRATIVASTDLTEDQIYEFTKALYEKQADLATGHDKFSLLNLEDAIKGMSVPFHPGAKKYYAEQGITVE